ALYIGAEGEAVLSLRVPHASMALLPTLGALGAALGSTGALALTVAVDLSDTLLPQGPLRGEAEADGTAVLRCPLVPTRRGRVAVERAWVRFAGPLGLVESTVRIGLGAEAAVLPNLLPVKSAALRFSRDRDFRAGLKIERYTGDGSEFDSLKE